MAIMQVGFANAYFDMTPVIIGISYLVVEMWLLIAGWLGRRRSLKCARLSFLAAFLLPLGLAGLLFATGFGRFSPESVALTFAFASAGLASLFLVRGSVPKNTQPK